MPQAQWARLQTDVKCTLRRGAWYRILKLTSADAVVDVKGKPVSIPRGTLQLSSTPGARWTVRNRASLKGDPARMRCDRCNGLFEVAWNEPYLAAG